MTACSRPTWAASCKGCPSISLEVRLENEAAEPRTALFSSAYRFSPPLHHLGGGPAEYRFGQRFDLMPKQYTEGQMQFNPNWQYSFGPGAVIRDGRMLVHVSSHAGAGTSFR